MLPLIAAEIREALTEWWKIVPREGIWLVFAFLICLFGLVILGFFVALFMS
jgi:hypothetical protein